MTWSGLCKECLMKKCVQPRTDHQTLWQASAGQSNFKQDSRHECLLTYAAMRKLGKDTKWLDCVFCLKRHAV